jgi:hypothetical protein
MLTPRQFNRTVKGDGIGFKTNGIKPMLRIPIATYKRFDRTLNDGDWNCGHQSRGINLSSNIGGQRQLIKRSIQRVIDDRDQDRTEDSYRKQSSQTRHRIIDSRRKS